MSEATTIASAVPPELVAWMAVALWGGRSVL